jgi:hypothetical protein
MTTFKAFSAIAAMALGAATILALPGFSPQVEAGTGARSPAVKADRLPIRPLHRACPDQAWPYYDARCLHDRRQAAGTARVVLRVIAVDNRSTRPFDVAGN